jgi:hypothetical protein
VKPRPLGWALTVIAAAVFTFFVVQPVVFAVYLTHLPTRRAVHDANLGKPKEPVTLTTGNGLRLHGWYVPSRNGAAVAVMHGTSSNRLGVADHARLLARHDYGVLIFDFHGHGASDGRSTSLPARFQPDADAALAFSANAPTSAPAGSASSGFHSAAKSPSTPPPKTPHGVRRCSKACRVDHPPT